MRGVGVGVAGASCAAPDSDSDSAWSPPGLDLDAVVPLSLRAKRADATSTPTGPTISSCGRGAAFCLHFSLTGDVLAADADADAACRRLLSRS